MFKKTFAVVAVFAAALTAVESASADVYVRGHFRSNGTYVPAHRRSNADSYFNNNWSTRPNINPYTGRTGTRTTPSYGGYSSPAKSYWGW